jgi:hypothetical protein
MNELLSSIRKELWKGFRSKSSPNPYSTIESKGLFGKWGIQVDRRGLKGILGNFDL